MLGIITYHPSNHLVERQYNVRSVDRKDTGMRAPESVQAKEVDKTHVHDQRITDVHPLSDDGDQQPTTMNYQHTQLV